MVERMGNLPHFFELGRSALYLAPSGRETGPMTVASPEPIALLAAFELSGDGVYAVDNDQRIVYWNAGAERILGHTAGEVIGKQCFDVIAGKDHLGRRFCGQDCRVIECARKGRAIENYDIQTQAADSPKWINVSIVVLKGRRSRSALTVHLVRDVTARRSGELDLGSALRAAESGRLLSGAGSDDPLTRREAEVLRLLACGLDNGKIAETLSVSPKTVRNHIEHLLAKFGVHSKLEAVVYAARAGLV
jgi:PAS domain S-box-containing protein